MLSFIDLCKLMESEAQDLFQAGAHGSGRQTKKGAALPPEHPRSLMDIGKHLEPRDKGYTRQTDAPEHVPARNDAASYYASKGLELPRIIDNLIRQDDKNFPPNEFVLAKDLIDTLKTLRTQPDRGYDGGESIASSPDEQIVAALDKMTAAPAGYKILSFRPSHQGRGYVILKGKRDIQPDEETTTRPGRYANPNQLAASKGMGVGGNHPVVQNLEKEVGAKLSVFKKEIDAAMKTGFGAPLLAAYKGVFQIINQLEKHSFVQEDKKAKYAALKQQLRQVLNQFAKTHGEESLQKVKPAINPDDRIQASTQQPAGMPIKAPQPARPDLAMAREWDEIYESVENIGW